MFVDALGGLFSVVAKDVEITVRLNKNAENYNKYFSDLTIKKTYGEMWQSEESKKNSEYKIKIL